MSLDAMKQALEALEFLALENFVELDKSLNVGPIHGRKAIIALRSAIEQAEKPRQWQGLTEDEKNAMVEWAHPDIIEAIELKLKERNGA